MAAWSNTDANTSSPIYASAQVNRAPTQANANLLFGNTTTSFFITNVAMGMFGVSPQEMQAANGAAPAHSGWALRTVGTGGRAGRVQYETLVALSAMSGDDEDTIFVDYRIVVNTQPSDSNEQTSNAISFTIGAATVPSGGTIRYQWQVDGGPSSQTWSNVANTGVYTNSNTSTLNISNNALLADNIYRVQLWADGADGVNSANVTISIY